MSDTGIRRATPSEVSELGQLSDRVFRPAVRPGTSMSKEFPLLFDSLNADNLYYVADGDNPVSLVGMLPGAVMTSGAAVSVVSMGSVCTLESHRKRRHASALIQQVIEDYSRTTSVLLVSGGLSIYRNVGCVDFGNWLNVKVLPSQVEKADDLHTLVDDAPDAKALFSLYSAEPMRFRRTVPEMESLLLALSTPGYRASRHGIAPRVFTARRSTHILAYLVAMPSAEDTGSVDVLEWAGSRSAVPQLAAHACRHFDGSHAILKVAESDATMMDWISKHRVHTERTQNQGTIRILNPAMLLSETKQWIHEWFGAVLTLVPTGDNAWTISWAPAPGHTTPNSHGQQLRGYGELSAWFFGRDGLQLPLPRTDDLNYV